MKRSLLAGLGLLALAAAMPAQAADLPRQGMPYKAPGYVAGLQLDRLLSRHPRRRRLGRFRLERRWIRDGRLRSAARRLQLAGHRQPVGVRPRGRHRLGRFRIDQHVAGAGVLVAVRPRPTDSARSAAGSATPWDRTMPYVTGGVAFGDNEANSPHRAFTAGISTATPMSAGPSAPASSTPSPATGPPRSNISTPISATDLLRAVCGGVGLMSTSA